MCLGTNVSFRLVWCVLIKTALLKCPYGVTINEHKSLLCKYIIVVLHFTICTCILSRPHNIFTWFQKESWNFVMPSCVLTSTEHWTKTSIRVYYYFQIKVIIMYFLNVNVLWWLLPIFHNMDCDFFCKIIFFLSDNQFI